MDRQHFFRWAARRFGVQPDYPWTQWPHYAVLRHPETLAWFAVVMDVPGKKLGLGTDTAVDIVNLKCGLQAAELAAAWPGGILPAWHMNKKQWISAVLDSDALPDETIEQLTTESFERTRSSTVRLRPMRPGS